MTLDSSCFRAFSTAMFSQLSQGLLHADIRRFNGAATEIFDGA